MKTLVKLLFVACVLFSASVVTAENKVEFDSFGSFDVSKDVDEVTNSNLEVKKYTINYEKMENPVVVYVHRGKNCKDFVVRTNGFEIMYKCSKNGFGANYIDKKYAMLSEDELKYRIDRTNYLHQRVITQHPNSDEYLVKLIASYLPDLMIKI